MHAWDAIACRQEKSLKYTRYYDMHGPWLISHAAKLDQYPGYNFHSALYVRSIEGCFAGPQPTIRIGGNGKVYEPGMLRTSQDRIFNMMSGSIASGNFKGKIYPNMQVWDKLVTVFINNANTGALISFACSENCSRNVLSILSDHTPLDEATTKPYGAGYNTRLIEPKYPQDPSLFEYPIKSISSEVIDLRNEANFLADSSNPSLTPQINLGTCFSEWIFEDIIFHTPKRPATTADHDKSNSPLQDFAQRARLAYPGQRYDADAPAKTDPIAAIPRTVPPKPGTDSDQAVVLYVPQPGAPAYQTGDPNLSAIDDLYGNIRPAIGPSMRPLEPVSVA